MTYSLRSWALLLGLGASLLTAATSCSKKEDAAPVAPVATTGTIEGTISPAGSLTTVTATNSGGLTFVATPNATTGGFSLANLVPGTYRLSFTPAGGFTAPADRTAAVTAGQTTAAGTVQVSGDGTPRGTFIWTEGGTTYTATAFTGTITSQLLRFEATATAGSNANRLIIDVPGFSGTTGSIVLGGNGPYVPGIGLVRTAAGIPTAQYNTYGAGYNTGALVVTNYDGNARTMRGTFGFLAEGTSGTNGTVSVTNGTFDLRF